MQRLPREVLLNVFTNLTDDTCRPQISNLEAQKYISENVHHPENWESRRQCSKGPRSSNPLLAIYLVCKLWQNLAELLLYRSIRIDLTDAVDESIPRNQLLGALQQNPARTKHIRNLRITFPTEHSPKLNYVAKLLPGPQAHGLEELLDLIQRLMGSVDKLVLDGGYHLVDHNRLLMAIVKLKPKHAIFSRGWSEYRLRRMSFVDDMGSLKTLHLYQNARIDDIPKSIYPLAPVTPGSSILESITITSGMFLPRKLEYILWWPKALKHLTFQLNRACFPDEGIFNALKFENCTPEWLSYLLWPHEDSLETIHLDDYGFTTLQTEQGLPDLSRFGALRELTIGVRNLLTETPSSANAKLECPALVKMTVLTARLRRQGLVWTDRMSLDLYHEPPSHRLVPWLVEFVQYRNEQYPSSRLRRLHIDHEVQLPSLEPQTVFNSMYRPQVLSCKQYPLKAVWEARPTFETLGIDLTCTEPRMSELEWHKHLDDCLNGSSRSSGWHVLQTR